MSLQTAGPCLPLYVCTLMLILHPVVSTQFSSSNGNGLLASLTDPPPLLEPSSVITTPRKPPRTLQSQISKQLPFVPIQTLAWCAVHPSVMPLIHETWAVQREKRLPAKSPDDCKSKFCLDPNYSRKHSVL